jgi:hypothetical protein
VSTNCKTTADFVLDATDTSYFGATKGALFVASFLKKCEGFFGIELDIIRCFGICFLVCSMVAITTELKLKLENAKITFSISGMAIALLDSINHLHLDFTILQHLFGGELDTVVLVDNSREIE